MLGCKEGTNHKKVAPSGTKSPGALISDTEPLDCEEYISVVRKLPSLKYFVYSSPRGLTEIGRVFFFLFLLVFFVLFLPEIYVATFSSAPP